jgi:hypothetical protein
VETSGPGAVSLQHHSGLISRHVEQFQAQRRPFERPSPGSTDRRVDLQVHLIDRAAVEQAACELAATGEEQITGDVVLQPANPVDRVTLYDVRVQSRSPLSVREAIYFGIGLSTSAHGPVADGQ